MATVVYFMLIRRSVTHINIYKNSKQGLFQCNTDVTSSYVLDCWFFFLFVFLCLSYYDMHHWVMGGGRSLSQLPSGQGWGPPWTGCLLIAGPTERDSRPFTPKDMHVGGSWRATERTHTDVGENERANSPWSPGDLNPEPFFFFLL